MTLFEQIKSIPKVDMHINLTSSISTDLAFDLSLDENMAEIISKMQEKNSMEYVNALKLPIKILKTILIKFIKKSFIIFTPTINIIKQARKLYYSFL